MELDGANTLLRRYVHEPGMDKPLVWYEGAATGDAHRRHLLRDRLGSVIAVADKDVAPHVNSYDAYGIPGAGNIGRFSYTGQPGR